jgi:hypothetical protein
MPTDPAVATGPPRVEYGNSGLDVRPKPPSWVQAPLTMRQCWLTVRRMVNHQHRLDRNFGAPVDPTRRAILSRLEHEDGVSVTELARPFPIKLPAVMKHLDVLDEAGLINRSKAGRTVTVRLPPPP